MSAAARSRGPLEGRTIVVTRPADQALVLSELISGFGGRAIQFPAIDIRDIEDRTRLNALIDRIDTFDLAVFISPNAARRGLGAVRARRELPQSLKIAAVGHGTARELERLGVLSVIVPTRQFDSEGLLRVPDLEHVRGRRIVIFRGVGGRAMLAETLVERGASVEYAECYERVKPAADATLLVQSCTRGEVDAFVATSSEGLRNVYEMLGETGQAALARTALFVPHPRIAATARELGLALVIVTQSGDAGIADAIVHHFAATP